MQPHDIMMKIHDIEILRKSCKMSTKIYENPLEYHIHVWNSGKVRKNDLRLVSNTIWQLYSIQNAFYFIGQFNAELQ